MLQVDLETSVGSLGVETTHYRGHTPEEWAKMAANRIVSISNEAPEPIRQQAHTFKDYLEVLLADYMQKAVESHICTICNLLEKQGHRDMAEIIRRL
jgi:hypothetical protein|tara:strand:+ start:112 stop:402 length:291 start_codon:yes stop_codon:yes gene_type:complete